MKRKRNCPNSSNPKPDTSDNDQSNIRHCSNRIIEEVEKAAPTAKSWSPLSDSERALQSVLFEYFDANRKIIIDGCFALSLIGKGELYRETHATYQKYISDIFSLSPNQAYRWTVRPVREIPTIDPRLLEISVLLEAKRRGELKPAEDKATKCTYMINLTKIAIAHIKGIPAAKEALVLLNWMQEVLEVRIAEKT